MSYEYDCSMSCGGCSGAIERVLKRAKDQGSIKDYSVSLDDQSVKVTPATATYEDVLSTIKKTGKAVNWGKNGQADAESYTDLGKAKLDGSVAKSALKLDA